MSRWGGASVEASLRVSEGGEASDGASPCESKGATKGSSGMVELMCGLHHVSSSGDQGKFPSGRATAWALL